MNSDDRKQWVEVFSSLASEPRLRIVDLLTHGEAECQEILTRFALSQPAISYHLGKLEHAGVLIKDKIGARRRYHLSPHLRPLIRMVTEDDGK